MGPQCFDGPVSGVGGESDIKKLVVVSNVGEGVAHAALEVLPGDVVVLRGAHGGGLWARPVRVEGLGLAASLRSREELEDRREEMGG